MKINKKRILNLIGLFSIGLLCGIINYLLDDANNDFKTDGFVVGQLFAYSVFFPFLCFIPSLIISLINYIINKKKSWVGFYLLGWSIFIILNFVLLYADVLNHNYLRR
jgi:hypothetical protein